MPRKKAQTGSELVVLPVSSPSHRQDHQKNADPLARARGGRARRSAVGRTEGFEGGRSLRLEVTAREELFLVLALAVPVPERRDLPNSLRRKMPASYHERLERVRREAVRPEVREAAEHALLYLDTGSLRRVAEAAGRGRSYAEYLVRGLVAEGPEWLQYKGYRVPGTERRP